VIGKGFLVVLGPRYITGPIDFQGNFAFGGYQWLLLCLILKPVGLADRRVCLDFICGIPGPRLLLAWNIDVVPRNLKINFGLTPICPFEILHSIFTYYVCA
jgi:hypothetical protein